jgi:hypothetical protein
VRLLQLDAALRGAVGAVDVPYWMGPVQAAELGDGLRLPYVGGEEGRTLRVRASGGWVLIDTEAATPLRFGPFAEAAVAAVYQERALWGVEVTVRLRRGMEPVGLRARVGSRAPAGEGG